MINVDISPKALRETLCIAQARIGNSGLDEHRQERDVAHLQALIDECDRHRPLGPDGKHGDRHTSTCGCEDVPCPECKGKGRVYGVFECTSCDGPATGSQPPDGA